MKVYVNESFVDGIFFGGGLSKSIVIIVVVVIIVIVVIFVVVGVVCYYRRCKGLDDFLCSYRSGNFGFRSLMLILIEIFGKDGLREFIFRELVVVIKNFFWMELFGCGGFGSVYRGILCDKFFVVVKCIVKDL